MTIRIALIIASVSTAACIALARDVDTWGGPNVVTWQGPNNLQDCSKNVQKRIESLDRRVWRRLSFECRDGLVDKLNAQSSSNDHDWITFLRDNSSLFGYGSVEIDSDGHQYFHGLPLMIMPSASAYDLISQRIYPLTYGENTFMLQGQFADTRTWKFQPPQISSETARRNAVEFWKSWPVSMEIIKVDGPYYLNVSAWQSENSVPSDKSYFLGWWVTGRDQYRSSARAAIDAANGRVISFAQRPVE